MAECMSILLKNNYDTVHPHHTHTKLNHLYMQWKNVSMHLQQVHNAPDSLETAQTYRVPEQ